MNNISSTILVVEDSFLNRRLIKKVLEEKKYQVLEATNTATTIEILNKNHIDLVILDINLDHDDEGIQIGNTIKQQYKLPFIYLTAYDTVSIINKAVESTPNSYLTKPFKNVDLIVSVELALQQSDVGTSNNNTSLHIKDENAFFHEILFQEIEYIESDGNYLLIHTQEKSYKHRSTMKNILNVLPNELFMQVHRAFLVNKDKIEKFNKRFVIVNNREISVSKKFGDTITQLL